MRFILLLFCLLAFRGFSQEKISFYFDFDQSEFSETEKQKIDDWIQEHFKLVVVKVEGFCDWLGNNPYNDKLSQKRIQSILNYLEGKINLEPDVETKAFGKRFEQNKFQDENRRVDVYYLPIIEVFEVEEQPPIPLVNELGKEVNATKVGDKIKLKNLYFYNMSGNFKPQSKPVLEELLQTMKINSKLKIEIQGHICCEPKLKTDLISKVRAVAVYNYLVENGIDKNRLQYKDFGSSEPIYKIPEKNDAERDANRRVELLILEK